MARRRACAHDRDVRSNQPQASQHGNPNPINRRQLLTSSVATAGGLGAMAAGLACAEVTTARPAAAATSPVGPSPGAGSGSFIAARDGTPLYYLDWGAGHPVVFLHAWGLNAEIWEYQMIDLVDHGLRCVAYDRRGHGRSMDPGHGYDFDTLADDLAAVLDRLELHDVTLVGHSMGGGEVARYLSRHGTRRIARVLLTSAITPIVGRRPDYPEGTDPRTVDAFIAALKHDRPATLAAGIGLFTGTGATVSPAMSQWVVSQFLRASPKGSIACQRAIADADFRPDMRAFTVPTLIIHGDADQVVSLDRNARATARAIRGSELKIYEGGSHGLIVADRERFNRDLLAFVRS
jgi:pimeloyl-ACP methyl ester carboxylesterase